MALWPAMQRPRLTGAPVSSAGIQSPCSTMPAAARTRGFVRRTWSALAQSHALEGASAGMLADLLEFALFEVRELVEPVLHFAYRHLRVLEVLAEYLHAGK